MKKRIHSVLSVLLCCCLFVSVLSLNVSAADGTGTFDASGMSVTGEYNDGSGTWVDCTGELQKGTYYNSSVFDGMYFVRFPASLPDKAVCMYLSEPFSISANHEYNLNFNWGFTQMPAGLALLIVYLNFYDSNGDLIRQQIITSQSKNNNFTIYDIDIDFKPNVDDLTSGYKCRLEICFTQNTSTTASEVFCISQKISLIDKDDNSSWFQKIINAIKEIPVKLGNLSDNISSFFNNLGDRIVAKFDDLKNNISSFFTGLGDRLSNKLSELSINITNKFEEIKDNLLDGLKSLFIPDEGYFDEYSEKTKTWASEHFGFLYTAADLFSSVVEDLKGLLRDDYSFKIPPAKFTLMGTEYTLWEEYEVPMKEYLNNSSLNFAYNTYLVMLSGALSFALLEYARKTYDKVMAN